MPSTSSMSSPITGIRDTPLLRKSPMVAPMVSVASTVIMSMRGIMISRTTVSLNSKMEWISSRSSSSSTSSSVASSTMLSSCCSDEKLADFGRPGVTRLPMATRAAATGPRKTRMPRTSQAIAVMSARAFSRPTLLGLDPTSTKEATIMISAEHNRASHHSSKREANDSVTSTAAIVSATTRTKLIALIWEPTSAPIAVSAFADRLLPARSRRSPRESTARAASAAAINPPNATRSTAMLRKMAITGDLQVVGASGLPALFHGETDQEVALQAEHLLLFDGFGVIETEQVQDAMGGQHEQLIERAVACRLGLGRGDLRAEHHVAQKVGRADRVFRARAQLVHREAEHVRRTRLVHPLDVKLCHRGLVDQQDREFGVRVHVQLVQGIDCQPLQHGLVDRDHRFVVDLDAHCFLPCFLACSSASYLVYASTIWPTRVWRTTSALVNRAKWISSMPSRTRVTSVSARVPIGSPTCVLSPVTTIFEPKPRRVRNIFICSGVVFWASSSTTKESLRVRPRM